jgi:hypothetical protein
MTPKKILMNNKITIVCSLQEKKNIAIINTFFGLKTKRFMHFMN